MKAPKYTQLQTVETPKINMKVFFNSKITEEEKNKVREYAKLRQLQENYIAETRKIESLLEATNSNWCNKHLWSTKDGLILPLFDMTDSHVKNAVEHLEKNERKIPKELKNEYFSRFGYRDFKEVNFYEPF